MKAIITDFDGTLFDTRRANFEAYRTALEDAGYVLSEETYNKLFGVRFDDLMRYLSVAPDLWETVKKKKAENYRKQVHLIRVNEDLLKFLESEHSNGVRIAVASTARLENIRTVLKHFVIENLFDCIVSGEDVEHPKPFPDVYMKALEKLHMKSEDAIAFEDTDIGVASARNAGIKCIKVII